MQEILNYYNNHAQAESGGMAVGWKEVANTMAKMVAAELQKAQTQTQTPVPVPTAVDEPLPE